MVRWADLLVVFLKVGTLGFGGPFALLALLEKETVERRGWLTREEFAHSTAIGTLTPGPIFFATAAHVGYRLRGIGGALLAAAATLLPGFVVAVAFAALYLRVEALPSVVGAAGGLTAGVTGLLAVMAVRQVRTVARDWVGVTLAALSLAGLLWLRLNPVWVIIVAALLGALLYRPAAPTNSPTAPGRRV